MLFAFLEGALSPWHLLILLLFIGVPVGVVLLVVNLTRRQPRDSNADLLAQMEAENERLEAENERLADEIVKLKTGTAPERPGMTDIKQPTTNI